MGRQRSRTPQGAGVIKDGKLDAIPSSTSLNHPPKTDFTKYDLNSHKVAIVDDISRDQGSEEGRVSPTQGEFVEVTSKKSQKERQRKEKEEQKRQEEERRRDENKKKRKQGGPPRSGSAGGSSDRGQQQSSSGSKPFSSWMMNAPGGSAPIASEGDLWDLDETLHSHLPVVSAAPGSQLKHLPPALPTTQPPPQAPPQTTPIPSQPQAPSMWPVDTPKPGVPHTAELVTSDYTLFGGSGGILSHAVDSTLPIASAMTAPMPAQQQGSTGVAGGQKETTVSGEKKREGWQPQPQMAKHNEQEPPHNDQEESKGSQKTEKSGPHGRAAGVSKNLPPRFKPQQQGGETSGPGRGRGARSSGRSSGERRGPGRDKNTSQESAEEKRQTSTAATTEQPADKDKVCT